MKRILLILLCLCVLSGCTVANTDAPAGTLSIVTTLFPQYDFARVIAGDLAQVRLLLPPGAESHSYEPTPADMIAINEADLFIYTGDEMEAWVPQVLASLEKDPVIVNLSNGIDLLHGHEGHDHDVDPHVFTNPLYAVKMAQAITDALCEIDPPNAAAYQSRGEAYIKELRGLDASLTEVTQNAARKKLIFGGRFAFLYLTEAYGLSYEAAYDSCSSESEPSSAKIADIIETVRKEKIPVVMYEELTEPKLAQLICEETGAKPLLLHSCHNISKEELAGGATYLSLMQQNIEHIKEGLN
ncbi:MAG: zinc ABC transporter substrate-binding protein [Ruminococcaceae bacterium]|nr:zinc ABC transporter substrate-binding protein [Oscillospiraceae bacterium]